MNGTDQEDPRRITARALVAQSMGRALLEDEEGAGAIFASLSHEELRFFAGAALEQATALAVSSLGSKEAAARYAEVVMLDAALDSTTEEA